MDGDLAEQAVDVGESGAAFFGDLASPSDVVTGVACCTRRTERGESIESIGALLES